MLEALQLGLLYGRRIEVSEYFRLIMYISCRRHMEANEKLLASKYKLVTVVDYRV